MMVSSCRVKVSRIESNDKTSTVLTMSFSPFSAAADDVDDDVDAVSVTVVDEEVVPRGEDSDDLVVVDGKPPHNAKAAIVLYGACDRKQTMVVASVNQ